MTRARKGWLAAALTVATLLAGCGAQAPGAGTAGRPVDPTPDVAVVTPPHRAADRGPGARAAAAEFIGVLRTMEPAIERECLQRRSRPINCDFQFVVDDRAGLEPNAFQTVDAQGRPIIGFTLALLAATRNSDELAFVVGHEASHHILGHIDQKTSAAETGAMILTGIAVASGGDPAAIRSAQQLGAQMGARYFSRDWELQADYLGAIIALRAGFDPVHGAEFFSRIPDPGDRVLGSHPSRAARQAQVARAVADLNGGRVS